MKISKSLLCIALSLMLVASMMPSNLMLAYAENEPIASEEQGAPAVESDDSSSVEVNGDTVDEAKTEEAAAETPDKEEGNITDGSKNSQTVSEPEPEETPAAVTEDIKDDADKAESGGKSGQTDPQSAADESPEAAYKDISLSVSTESDKSSVPADEEWLVTVKAKNPNKDGEAAEARIYLWDYDKDFFDDKKKDDVKKANDQITVKGLDDDRKVSLDTKSGDADKVEITQVTEENAHYLKFDVPADTELEFEVPLAAEEEALEDLTKQTEAAANDENSDAVEGIHIIVEPVIDGQDEDSKAVGDPMELSWDAKEKEAQEQAVTETGPEKEAEPAESEEDQKELTEEEKTVETLKRGLVKTLNNHALKADPDAIASGVINDKLSWKVVDASGGNYELIFIGSGTIPANFQKTEAFSNYKSKTVKVTIPEGVTEIGNNAFLEMKSIKEVDFQTGESGNSQLKKIGDCAFKSCSGLNTINLPDSLTSMGREAFSDANRIAELVIPSGG